MITKNNRIIVCGISIFLVLQFIPWKHASQNMFKTQEDILISYGAPVNFLTFHSVRILATNKINQLGNSHSFMALIADAVLIIASGLLLWMILARHNRFRLAILCLLILGCGFILFANVPFLCRKVRLAHRIEFANNAIKCVNGWYGNKDWIESQKAILKQQKPTKDSWSPGITSHFMLLKNGEWFVFYQGECKTDNSIDDILIMKGSDGKWYFTDTHICVDMFEFRITDACLYENLNAVVADNSFMLETFTDQDKLFQRSCLYKYWR